MFLHKEEPFLDIIKVGVADEEGFIRIRDTLQCEPGPSNVFAVGDCATSATDPRPKAGVFAVRQGLPLEANIRRFCPSEVVSYDGSDPRAVLPTALG